MKQLISIFTSLLIAMSQVSISNAQTIETREYDNGVYVGLLSNDTPNGRGTLTHISGDTYVGEFINGFFHGTGTYSHTSGWVFNGEFREGDPWEGTQVYPEANGVSDVNIYRNGEIVDRNKIPSRTPESSELIQAASGSAFSVSFDGYLVTNNHVIEGCENIRVHSEGMVIDAVVISRDPGNDLAVIKANFRPAAVFALRDGNPQLMQEIYVAGFPFGENLSSSVKVTKGIVSSLTGLGNNFSNIQIDAAIQPGNSGGPIFDDNGNVLGVAVSSLDIRFALENFDAIPQNTNFGIKANIVSNLLSSNGIEIAQPNTSIITTAQLGALATDATFYLSCWMTTAQIQEMSSTKVLFNQLRN